MRYIGETPEVTHRVLLLLLLPHSQSHAHAQTPHTLIRIYIQTFLQQPTFRQLAIPARAIPSFQCGLSSKSKLRPFLIVITIRMVGKPFDSLFYPMLSVFKSHSAVSSRHWRSSVLVTLRIFLSPNRSYSSTSPHTEYREKSKRIVKHLEQFQFTFPQVHTSVFPVWPGKFYFFFKKVQFKEVKNVDSGW